jgi:cellulose biosynthesis protein BcsQ
MRTIAFFNNKGGVGKTTLVYHLAWMYADMGLPVVAADLDPQANLTSMFLEDDRIEQLWSNGSHSSTVYGALQPLLEGTGDVASPHVENLGERLGLVVGDLSLAMAEGELSGRWPDCLDRDPRAFRVLSALWRMLDMAARERGAQTVLIDVGPNLGALNRAVLVTADHVLVPLAPDLYSLQGLRNLGPTLKRWREEWTERRARNPVSGLAMPSGMMTPRGYVVLQHAVRLDRPVRAYGKWMERIPGVYRQAILGEVSASEPISLDKDPHCLATLKHYRSLMPLAQEARKPMFFLKPADGAIGGHSAAVQACYDDFEKLARAVASHCGIALL